MSESFDEGYRAVVEAAGVVDCSQRTEIEVWGDDRASFLHNLSTNDVKKLQPGQGCEAFFLDARGHVIGHVFLVCRPESIVVDSVAGQNGPLLKHLDRYLIREKVELVDQTAEWYELLVAGPQSRNVLSQLSADLPVDRLSSVEMAIHGHPATAVRVEMTAADGYLVIGARASLETVVQTLLSLGAVACDRASFEAARIEAGFPWFGQDISDKTLPQEVGRDDRAISFTKGCYIGQETVARIDALGHVNKKLVRVRFAGEKIPPPGTELQSGEQTVGQVTSAAYSPKYAAPLGLAYVRRGSDMPGGKLTSEFGEALVM